MVALPFTPLPTASYAWVGDKLYTHPYRFDVPGRCSISGPQVASTVKLLGLNVVAGEPPMPMLLPALTPSTVAERAAYFKASRRQAERERRLETWYAVGGTQRVIKSAAVIALSDRRPVIQLSFLEMLRESA